VPTGVVTLDEAVELTRTGDLWLFRGKSLADHAIRVTTNSPVNHVGVAVTVEDLPPLMWHAELGRSLPDAWTGQHQRGAQLHDLRDAVVTWAHRYGQRAWFRQLDPPADRPMEDAALQVVARMNGTPFPSTAGLAGRWVKGRTRREASLETAYCAEVVAATYTAMGLLPERRPANWYDPGRFWSGDRLELLAGRDLGAEIEVAVAQQLAAAQGGGAAYPPAVGDTYTVQRSTAIAAPPQRVYDLVADFHEWRSWSPWEDVDPQLSRTYSGPRSGAGARYGWSGNRQAGAGRMEIVEVTPPSLVRVDLEFTKPFRSRNDFSFVIEPDGTGSQVTWTMVGQKSLATRVMGLVRSMDKMLGPDFERGLARLKAAAETPAS
jgi:uncharacterized protein YndB with AHSA1/START domain